MSPNLDHKHAPALARNSVSKSVKHSAQVPNVADQSEEGRILLAEGPLVLGRIEHKSLPVIQIGVPENMMTWQLTEDMPVLKVSNCATMFAVPYSQQYYLVEFLPGASPPAHHFPTMLFMNISKTYVSSLNSKLSTFLPK